MLLMPRQQALTTVKLSMSCSANGPLGFCRAARMAAFNPGSGMDTVCASVEVQKLTSASTVRTSGRVKRMMVFILWNAGVKAGASGSILA